MSQPRRNDPSFTLVWMKNQRKIKQATPSTFQNQRYDPYLQKTDPDWAMQTVDDRQEAPVKILPFSVFETINEDEELDFYPAESQLVPLGNASCSDVSTFALDEFQVAAPPSIETNSVDRQLRLRGPFSTILSFIKGHLRKSSNL